MSTVSSVNQVQFSAAQETTRLCVALEVLFVYAGILYYIWRWQFNHPAFWKLLLAMVILSHVTHCDTLRDLGLYWSELRASAQVVLPLTLAVYLPLIIYGFAHHSIGFLMPTKHTVMSFAGYGSWCVFQQYLTQSYFHNRLLTVVRNPHLSSLLVGLMFGGAHIPNPILVVVTTAGGFFLAEVFARHRNIWPLALAQTVGGFLVAALSPSSIIHNMRVGPGYFFYGLH